MRAGSWCLRLPAPSCCARGPASARAPCASFPSAASARVHWQIPFPSPLPPAHPHTRLHPPALHPACSGCWPCPPARCCPAAASPGWPGTAPAWPAAPSRRSRAWARGRGRCRAGRGAGPVQARTWRWHPPAPQPPRARRAAPWGARPQTQGRARARGGHSCWALAAGPV